MNFQENREGLRALPLKSGESDHFVSRRSPYRDDHLRLAQEAYRRGEILLAGALSDPVDAHSWYFTCQRELSSKLSPAAIQRDQRFW